jgi:hypothetical protein
MRFGNVLRIAVRIAAGVSFVVIGLPSLLLGILGLQDRLMDAGAGQNESLGRSLLANFTLILLLSVAAFLFTRSPKT